MESRMASSFCKNVLGWVLPAILVLSGCRQPSAYRAGADKVASKIIQEKQKQALGRTEPFTIERPSDILRRRLLIEQNLPRSSEASLGSDKLKPIKHWPDPNYPHGGPSGDAPDVVIEPNKPVKLSLIDALQIGARNSADYQTQKETVFQKALDLDFQRNTFRNIFTGTASSEFSTNTTGTDTVNTLNSGGTAGVSRTLKNGMNLMTMLTIDLVNLLTQGGTSSLGLTADASVSMPLLRGAGRHIVTEQLTQAERNVVYEIWTFERYKHTFAVDIASRYLSVLQQIDTVRNSEENYRSVITSARRSRRLADAGQLSQVQLDQAVQSELIARNNWISAQEQLKGRLDSFKSSIGLPPDAQIELDRADLEQLRAPATKMVEEILKQDESEPNQPVLPADAPIELVPPSNKDAGPLEIGDLAATRLALENRLDLQVTIGKVYDAQRQVVVAADALKPKLMLGGKANLSDNDDGSLRFKGGQYSAPLSLDLPFDEKTVERRNAYRNSLIYLESKVRAVQTLEDAIKLAIRNTLRTLLESRESLKIQARSVVVAQRRVVSSTLFLEAGRVEIRDLLDAQAALLSAQNSLTSAVINYRLAELGLQRDMGLLAVNEKGLWQELSPEVLDHAKQQK
jgi:outer membrane protein TolC